MKIGFTGTRKIGSLPVSRLHALHTLLMQRRHNSPKTFIHGGCYGADTYAHMLAGAMDYTIVVRPSSAQQLADMRMYHGIPFTACNVRPPLDRNRDIVDSCDFLVAMPENPEKEVLRSGTWATIRYARRIGKEVIFV